MNTTIASRIRRAAAIASASLALGFGGLAAAPAHAQTVAPADSASCSGNIWVFNAHFTSYSLHTTTGVVAAVIPAVLAPNGDNGLDMQQGGKLTCTWPNGIQEELTVQGDGNFVLYVNNGNTWSPSPTVRPNASYAVFQTDGNLVVRNSGGGAIWASNTHTYPNAILAFQDDGNLVIYPSSSNFTALWATGTYS